MDGSPGNSDHGIALRAEYHNEFQSQFLLSLHFLVVTNGVKVERILFHSNRGLAKRAFHFSHGIKVDDSFILFKKFYVHFSEGTGLYDMAIAGPICFG